MFSDDNVGLRNLSLYFVIAFAFTWSLWLPQALISTGLISLPQSISDFLFSPYNPAAFGPLVAAFLLTSLNEGRQGVGKLLKRGVAYRFKKRYYIPIFLLNPALAGGALLLAVLSGEPLPALSALSNPPVILVAFFYIFFLGGPFQEEWGWRGYALPRLQARWSALYSSLILGLLWGAWHIPLFYISGTIQSQTPMWGFMILIISGSIMLTWIYNNTGGSILATMLFHTMINLSFFMFPTFETVLGGLYLLILSVLAAAVVVAVFGPRTLMIGVEKG